MLRLFEAKGTYKSLTIARNVNISHIARVINSWLSLKMVTALVLMASLIHARNLHWVLVMALIDRIRLAVTVQVVLTCD